MNNIGLFFSAELLAPLTLSLFLSTLEKKERKINGAKSSTEKNRFIRP